MIDATYENLVEEAAESLSETGMVDLVILSAAVAGGYQADAFVADAYRLSETNTST